MIFFWQEPGEKLIIAHVTKIKEKQMKKFLITVAITGLIGGMAFAQTNVVSSANVVGYNQITIPSNQFVLVSLDFNNESNSINSLFGTLPTGSQVSLWNATLQSWVVIQKTRSGWGTGGTNVLNLGSGAFIKVPAETNIYFSGDVPMDPTSTVHVASGFKFVSYPYPVDMAFTNTALAKEAPTGDQVSAWSNGWIVYQKTRSGWGAGTNLQIKVGQALFYKGVTNRAADEVKPYTIN